MTASASPVAVYRPPLILLIVISSIGPIALNIFMPSMPGMQRVFGVDYATVQLTLTFYLAAMAASQIVFGPLSDRYGRRPVLLLGLACFITGSALAAAAPSIETLILARMLQGLGGASGIVIARAIIRDCYSRERSASMIGYVTMGMVVGPMVSPFFGGLLDESFGWQSSFLALVAIGLPVLVMVFLVLSETHTDRAGGGFGALARGGAVLMKSRAFWAYAATLGFASAAFFAFLAAAPLIAVDVMGLSPSEYGYYFPLGAIGYMSGNFVTGRFAERVGPDRMILAGNLLGIAATGGFVVVALVGVLHPLTLFLPMMFVAFSNGLVMPSATASAVSIRPDVAGAAAGISGAFQLTVGALVTVFVGAIQNGTELPLALTMAAAIWLSFLASLAARRWLAKETGAA